MAKRAKKANGAAKAAPAIKTIDEASFKRLCNALRNAQSDKDEAGATIGGLISSAVEKKHLHKKAFGIYRALAKLSDPHLATALAHLDHYRDIGGLNQRAARQSEMFERTELEEDEGELVQFDNQAEREEAAEFEPEAA